MAKIQHYIPPHIENTIQRYSGTITLIPRPNFGLDQNFGMELITIVFMVKHSREGSYSIVFFSVSLYSARSKVHTRGKCSINTSVSFQMISPNLQF